MSTALQVIDREVFTRTEVSVPDVYILYIWDVRWHHITASAYRQ